MASQSSQSQSQDSHKPSSDRVVKTLAFALVIGSVCAVGSFLIRSLPPVGSRVVRDGSISVVVQPLAVSEKYLDGMDWNLNRKLGKAFTYWSFIDRTDFEWEVHNVPGARNTYSVTASGAKITLSLPITMWLPYGVQDWLHDHENGHKRICEQIYADGPRIAIECVKPLIGSPIQVTAKDPLEAKTVANQTLHVGFSTCYKSRTQDVADRVNELFDAATRHGLNQVPVNDGIEEAFSRFKSGRSADTPDASAKKSYGH